MQTPLCEPGTSLAAGLPIEPYRTLDDAIAYVNACPGVRLCHRCHSAASAACAPLHRIVVPRGGS